MSTQIEYQFGSGVLFAKPVGGNLDATIKQTPMQFGVLQEVSLEFSFDNKELHGQYQFPVDTARGKGKITGKAKYAQFNSRMVNAIFWGQPIAAGQDIVQLNEVHPIPGTPYQITIAPPASGTFKEDLGVINGVTGLQLDKVAATPATGQYSVDETTGIYTFAAADTTISMLFSYRYNVTTGFKTTISNQLMGYAPVFEAVLFQNYNGLPDIVKLNSCKASKLGRSTKLDDYTIPEFDFSAFADATGSIGNFNSPQ